MSTIGTILLFRQFDAQPTQLKSSRSRTIRPGRDWVFRVDGQGRLAYSGTVAPAHYIQNRDRFEMFRFTDVGERELIRKSPRGHSRPSEAS